MIILDTNVLSALMQQRPEPCVIAWLDAQAAESIFMTSITLFEARFGLEAMDHGRRRTRLVERFEAMLAEDLGYRILAFDSRAAEQASGLAVERRVRGRPVDIRDTFIAGIAIAHGATLATRNTRHFVDLPVPVIDPWEFEHK